MRQIDVMISHQKQEWEAEMELRLKSGRDELLTSRTLVERRDLEVNWERWKHLSSQPTLILIHAAEVTNSCCFVAVLLLVDQTASPAAGRLPNGPIGVSHQIRATTAESSWGGDIKVFNIYETPKYLREMIELEHITSQLPFTNSPSHLKKKEQLLK